MTKERTLYLLEGDEAVRSSATLLLTLFGWTVVGYAQPEEFLEALSADDPLPTCLVASIDTPSALLALLQGRGLRVPTVVTTADPIVATDLRRSGTQCLAKPFDIRTLLLAIGVATATPAPPA